MNGPEHFDYELTVLMPCLNEAETLGKCIDNASNWISQSRVSAEIVVADNGSCDGSQQIASKAGARVIDAAIRGYGSAIRAGIDAAQGQYIIMGDADDSYEFENLGRFLERLRAGDDLVIGNRFEGGILPGAMPFLHRYVGNPILSLLGRLMFGAPIGDFHCGLRGMRASSIRSLDLRTTGMEFASEMIIKAALRNLKISEVPTILRPDGRTRSPHLRTWTDGWRHLRFLLLFSPRWLFLIPGLTLLITGFLMSALLVLFGNLNMGSIQLSTGTLVYASAAVIIGFQAVSFAYMTRVLAVNRGFLPRSPAFDRLFGHFTLERGLLVGFVTLIVGVSAALVSLLRWKSAHLGYLDPLDQARLVVPSALGIILGSSTILHSFVFSIIGMDSDASSR